MSTSGIEGAGMCRTISAGVAEAFDAVYGPSPGPGIARRLFVARMDDHFHGDITLGSDGLHLTV
ncbi:hypothetical protein [Streptomyces sp. NPDC055400]